MKKTGLTRAGLNRIYNEVVADVKEMQRLQREAGWLTDEGWKGPAGAGAMTPQAWHALSPEEQAEKKRTGGMVKRAWDKSDLENDNDSEVKPCC